MTIRQRVRRALRKSESSSDSISQTESNPTSDTANTSQSSSDTSALQLQKTTSKLAKTFTFGTRDKEKEKERKSSSSKKKPLHPSQKPLTAQNLRHQQMLGQFTMTFGTNNISQLELPDFDGVSPCCTRAPSIDGAAVGPDEVA